LIGIGNDGIRKAATRSSQLYYSCGDIVALLTESAIKRGNTNRDLFDFWRALFTRAVARDSTYAADDYFAVLSELNAPPDAVRDIRAFVEGVDRTAIPAMLTSRGISLVPVDTPPESYGQTLSRRALFSLLGDICTGRYGFRVQRSGMLLDAGAKCEGLPPGATVKAIGGHDLLRAGHLAWDYMHERCSSAMPLGITIEVQGDGQPVVQETNAACKRPIAERGSYFRIASRPH
jgi:predicted metalloprotease with PDZ domain